MLLKERLKSVAFRSVEPRVSIVIPALNEVEGVHRTVGSIMQAVDTLDKPGQITVFVVDNGSKDGTQAAVTDIAVKRKNLRLLNARPGVGHARRAGARAAFRSMYDQDNSIQRSRWVISTDADVLVPDTWLVGWFSLLQENNPGIVVGNIKLPDEVDKTYPNAAKVMKAVGERVAIAEEIFGITNTHGNHFAIESASYSIVGPFQQPVSVSSEGQVQNVCGEDWDIGTRARTLGMPIARSPHEPVIASARRFYPDPIGFLNGSTYDGEFKRVNADIHAGDIAIANFDQLVSDITYTQCKFYISKPLLADATSIDKPEVRQFLGKQLHEEIKKWTTMHPKPDIFEDRNGFQIDYVNLFHEVFGKDINKQLLIYKKY